MVKFTPALVLLASFMLPISAQADTEVTSTTTTEINNPYVLTEQNKRLVNTYLRMFRYYTKRNFSVTRTVRVLMSNYPEHVEAIMIAALERYPENYPYIIKAAIDAEPAFTRDIMAVAMHLEVAPATELVKIAVEAEPAYADQIVVDASKSNPNDVEAIVRIAVSIQPEMAPSIMQSAGSSQPDKVEGIVHATLSVLPSMGDYLMSSLNDLIDLIRGNSANEMSDDQRETLSVLRGAHRAGMSYADLQRVAKNHGISDAQLTAALNQ